MRTHKEKREKEKCERESDEECGEDLYTFPTRSHPPPHRHPVLFDAPGLVRRATRDSREKETIPVPNVSKNALCQAFADAAMLFHFLSLSLSSVFPSPLLAFPPDLRTRWKKSRKK